jgi:hypothetical protein
MSVMQTGNSHPKAAEARKLVEDSFFDEAKSSHIFEHLIEPGEVNVE